MKKLALICFVIALATFIYAVYEINKFKKEAESERAQQLKITWDNIEREGWNRKNFRSLDSLLKKGDDTLNWRHVSAGRCIDIK